MDKRRIYWILVVLGAAIAVAGIYLRKTGGPALQQKAAFVGWGGIAVMLLARFFFKPARQQAQDVKDLFPPKKQG